MLRGEFNDGDTIFVDVENERLAFKRVPLELLTVSLVVSQVLTPYNSTRTQDLSHFPHIFGHQMHSLLNETVGGWDIRRSLQPHR